MPHVLAPTCVRRGGFLATLDSRTWRARAAAAGALADAEAVAGRAAYAAWLGRVAAAWSRLPQQQGAQGHPDVADAGAPRWPLDTVGPACLALLPELDADLHRLAVPAGAPEPALPNRRGTGAGSEPHDEAFLVGAAYVAVVAAADAAVLTSAATALAERDAQRGDAPVGTRFLRACRDLAPAHRPLRAELAGWAATAGPQAGERAVLTARALTLDLAEALRAPHPGS